MSTAGLTRPWPYDGPEGRARLTGNLGVAECSDPPAESCSDAGCPVHGDSDDWWDADERGDDDE